MSKSIDKNIYYTILRLFSKKGPTFTTDDLARELSTSKRTIYTLFKNKKDLINKTIDFIFIDIKKRDHHILTNESLSLEEKVEHFFKNIPTMYNVGLLLKHGDNLKKYDPSLWRKVNDYLDNVWDDLFSLLEKRISHVQLILLQTMLKETMKQLLTQDPITNNKITFEDTMEELGNIILYGVIRDK
ncbi:TetR/AcrR family transcriptional regulator [Salipaludibacillus sp. LMS25]|jgi:AcrR family transcriptional regulator|uniref:TetR/AcrR family transcriptional regulator n=1 Tax=Salipaludibacillus sp. LMS25 TaxID=2924031 RepID=UPI0020D18AA0|nr:TetR/AcrR family transcriptional regulator [Salipaludibacillus sp. LMS25]UTR13789.1 TetR/AcrR family transcriptional regulator [Salipaludibacillus sp. LMS25]